MLYIIFSIQARILASEAEKQELINASEGSAKAVVAAGEARAKSIEIVAKVSSSKSHQLVRDQDDEGASEAQGSMMKYLPNRSIIIRVIT